MLAKMVVWDGYREAGGLDEGVDVGEAEAGTKGDVGSVL
jgi:hypothetical protein